MKTCFYTAEHIAAVKRKNRIGNGIFVLLWALALGLCVSFCLRANVLNASRMELCAVLTFTLAGWIGITLTNAVLRYNRALYRHEERLLGEGQERKLRGRLRLEKKAAQIPGGLTVRSLRLETEEGELRLHVAEIFARELERAAAGGELTVYVRQGFVTGYAP